MIPVQYKTFLAAAAIAAAAAGCASAPHAPAPLTSMCEFGVADVPITAYLPGAASPPPTGFQVNVALSPLPGAPAVYVRTVTLRLGIGLPGETETSHITATEKIGKAVGQAYPGASFPVPAAWMRNGHLPQSCHVESYSS